MTITVKDLETIVQNRVSMAQRWFKLTDDAAIHALVVADPTIRRLRTDQQAKIEVARDYVRCVAVALRAGDHRRLRRLRRQLGSATYDQIIAMLEAEGD